MLLNEQGEEELQTDCWTFDRNEVCSLDAEACGPWSYHRFVDDPRPAFRARIHFVPDPDSGVLEATARLRGLVERRGDPAQGDAIGGVAVLMAPDSGVSLDFGFTGREVESCSDQ